MLSTELITEIGHRKEFKMEQKMELRYWWEYVDGKTRLNKLNEKRLLIPGRLRVPIWKVNFCSRVLRLSELLRCREKLQTAICHREINVSSDWFGCFLVISFHVAKVLSESVSECLVSNMLA